MTTHERRLVLKTGLLGVALALAVAGLSQLGVLDTLENLLSDRRAKWFQFFSSPPTDRIVHLDIDDGSVEAIGRPPWSREVFAQIIDELTALDARVIGLDVTFSDRQRPHDGIDPDALLAQAIRRSGRVVLPVDFNLADHASDLELRLTRLLVDDLELSLPGAVDRLRSVGVDASPDEIANAFVAARKAACQDRVTREVGQGHADLADLRRRLLPRTDPTIANSPLLAALAEAYDRAMSFQALRRLARPAPPDVPPAPTGRGDRPPIPPLAAAAGGVAFVDFAVAGDNVVRCLPMWVEHDGAIYPQLGLALACRQLGVAVGDVRLDAGGMVIPRPADAGGDLRVPLRTLRSDQTGERITYVMDVPWFGPQQQWVKMYPGREAHIPVTQVWDLVALRARLRRNNAAADDAIKYLYDKTDPAKRAAYEKNLPAADDTEARAALMAPLLAEAKSLGMADIAAATQPESLSVDDRDAGRAIHALSIIPQQNRALADSIRARTEAMGKLLRGRTVLIGLTASGALDVVATPLHARCPGVVVHGAVFSAILTGDVWRSLPRWGGPAVALGLGLLTAAAVAFLSPVQALAAVLALAGLFCVVDASVLFDYGNILLPPAAPLLAVAAVWSGGTLHRFVAERAERTRITRRFQNYVDPGLVDYVIQNPDRARLDGEVRQMSIVFTDLANFTTLSERLKEQTVPILNEYLSLMIPLITARRGYVNKFLGDGIMFFFGAPLQNPAHASDAVRSVLAMQEAMASFNESLTRRGLPNVSMRAGVSAGDVVVGDAGMRDRNDPSRDRSDYTVLGDEVNLASRLEGANKALGTRVLVSGLAAELAGAEILFRPVARLQVVGKTAGVMTFEPLSLTAAATDQHRRVALLTRQMVEPFLAGDFAGCLAAADRYAEALGGDKLAGLYRQLATEYLAGPPPTGFDGRIKLSEK